MRLACDVTVIRHPMTGVQNAVFRQLRALAKQAHAVPDLSPLVFGRPDLLPDLPGATVLPVPGYLRNPLWRILWQQTVLPRALRNHRADILQAFAYTAPLCSAVPVVLNVHDIIALEHPELCSRLNALHMRALLPESIRRAARCLVSTRHGADGLIRTLRIPAKRIRIVPLGVDTAFFEHPAPPPACLNGRPYFLFVSSIEPKKDLDTLLDAYDACADRLDADLVVIGRAAWKSEATVRRLLMTRKAGRLHWLRGIPTDDLPAFYQHACALVVPSRTEGFGLPVLEAMAAGTPVIHSTHPALCEAAGGAGLPFPIGDAGALADTLLLIRNRDALRSERILAGKHHAARRTWSRWAANALRIIRALHDHPR